MMLIIAKIQLKFYNRIEIMTYEDYKFFEESHCAPIEATQLMLELLNSFTRLNNLTVYKILYQLGENFDFLSVYIGFHTSTHTYIQKIFPATKSMEKQDCATFRLETQVASQKMFFEDILFAYYSRVKKHKLS